MFFLPTLPRTIKNIDIEFIDQNVLNYRKVRKGSEKVRKDEKAGKVLKLYTGNVFRYNNVVDSDKLKVSV